MDDDRDRYHPTNATYEGQLISLAGGLRRYKYGKPIALIVLLVGALVFGWLAFTIATSM